MINKIDVVLLLFILSLGYILFPLSAENQENKRIDWTKLKETGEIYFENPSSENAYKFYKLLPSRRIKDSCNIKSIMDFVFDAKNFGILEKQIFASDLNAVKVAFRLFNISSVEPTERITITLGHLIRINPKLFLEELKNHRSIKFIKEVGPPIKMFGWEYVDRFKAMDLERRLRIKALESVKNKALIEIRDECIKILKSMKF